MSEWVKVVTHPLGLAGFALFLVFGYLAKEKRQDTRRWLPAVAVAMAVITLVGGLYLSYSRVFTPPGRATQTGMAPPPIQHQANQQIQQTTSGPGSPAIQGVQGDVTITVDQSSGQTGTTKADEKKLKP